MEDKIWIAVYTSYCGDSINKDTFVTSGSDEPNLLQINSSLDFKNFMSEIILKIDKIYNREIIKIETVDNVIINHENYNLNNYEIDLKHLDNPLFLYYGDFINTFSHFPSDVDLNDVSPNYIIIKEDYLSCSVAKSINISLGRLQTQISNLLYNNNYKLSGNHTMQITKIDDKYYCVCTQALIK